VDATGLLAMLNIWFLLLRCGILGSYRRDHEDYYLLDCDAV
jgi:hypothetical protein